MPSESGLLTKLSKWALESPIRRLVVSYVVGGWAILEVVVTACDLASLPSLLPRLAFLALTLGLLVALTIRLVRGGVLRLRQTATRGVWGTGPRILMGLTILFALLPLSFYWSGEGARWIM